MKFTFLKIRNPLYPPGACGRPLLWLLSLVYAVHTATAIAGILAECALRDYRYSKGSSKYQLTPDRGGENFVSIASARGGGGGVLAKMSAEKMLRKRR